MLFLDTKEACFICHLKNDGETVSKSELQRNFVQVNIRSICQYLKINLSLAVNEASAGIVGYTTPALTDDNLTVTCCQQCSQVTSSLSNLVSEMEVLQMKIGYTVKSLHDKLTAEDPCVNDEARKNAECSSSERIQKRLVNILRKETKLKCANRLETVTLSPRVTLKEMESVKVKVENISSPPSSDTDGSDSDDNDDEEEEMETHCQSANIPAPSTSATAASANATRTLIEANNLKTAINWKVTRSADKRYRCPWCAHAVWELAGYQGHVLTNHPDQLFLNAKLASVSDKEFVDLCREAVKSPEHEVKKEATIKGRHKGKRACAYCPKQFPTRGACNGLDRHVIHEHFSHLAELLIRLQCKTEEDQQKLVKPRKRNKKTKQGPSRDKDKRERPWKCNVCSADFFDSNHLWDHMRRKNHGSTQDTHCSTCGLDFGNRILLGKHLRLNCRENRPEIILASLYGNKAADKTFYCSFCPTKGLKEFYTLKMHVINRHIDKLYVAKKLPTVSEANFKICCEYLLEKLLIAAPKAPGNSNSPGQARLACIHCSKTSRNSRVLKFHLIIHHENLLWDKLEHAQKEYSQTDMKKFLLQTKKSNSLPLGPENKLLAMLSVTTTKNSDDNLYRCPFCDKGLTTTSRVKMHIIAFHAEKIFTKAREKVPKMSDNEFKACCNHLLETTHKDLANIKSDANPKPQRNSSKISDIPWNMPCEHCGKVYNDRRWLVSHLIENHLNQLLSELEAIAQKKKSFLHLSAKKKVSFRRWKCKDCGSIFTRYSYLNQHRRHLACTRGYKDKLHTCQQCKLKFGARSDWVKHIRLKKCTGNRKNRKVRALTKNLKREGGLIACQHCDWKWKPAVGKRIIPAKWHLINVHPDKLFSAETYKLPHISEEQFKQCCKNLLEQGAKSAEVKQSSGSETKTGNRKIIYHKARYICPFCSARSQETWSIKGHLAENHYSQLGDKLEEIQKKMCSTNDETAMYDDDAEMKVDCDSGSSVNQEAVEDNEIGEEEFYVFQNDVEEMQTDSTLVDPLKIY